MIKISAIKKDIILYLESNVSATNSQISTFFEKDEGGISKHLKDLKEAGLININRESEGKITRNFNSLTDRGLEISRDFKEGKKVEQVVQNFPQVVNKLKFSPSKDQYDLDNINLRERCVPASLDLYLDDTKTQVGLIREELDFFWELHTKLCNYRVKKNFTNRLLKILRRLEGWEGN